MFFGIMDFFKKKEEIDYTSFNLEERVDYIKKCNKISPKVIEYVRSLFDNLIIQIAGVDATDLFSLMERGDLQHFPFETTETLSVFFEDEDYVVRGDIKVGTYKDVFHSWICFIFEGEEYVLDPSLNVLAKKDLYEDTFEVTISNKMRAIVIKHALVEILLHPNKSRGEGNRNAPFYENKFKYEGSIEDQKIKELTVHYECN